MTLGREALAAVLIVAEGGAALAVAGRVARRLSSDLLEQLAAGALLVVSQVIGIPVVLACIDLLGRWPVATAQLALAAVVLALVHPPPAAPGRRPRTAQAIGAAGAAVVIALVWLRVGLRGGLPNEPDTRQYHIASLASWFQRHNLWHLPFAITGYPTATFPGNGEMAALWAVLPSGGDQMAYAVNVLFVGLAILAAAFLGREMGVSAGAAALAALAVVACPIVWQGSAFSLQNDLPAAATLAMAVALLLRYRRTSEPAWAALCGLALGLAVGSKYTVAVPAATLVVAGLLTVPRRRHLLFGLPGLLVLAGPWLLRNAIATGNPIFAEQVTLAGKTLLPGGNTPFNVADTRLFTHLIHGRTIVLRRWLHLAMTEYGPGGILAAIGLLAGWWRRRVAVLIVTATALAATVGYLVEPYTGGGAGGVAISIVSAMRYLLPALLLGAVLAAAALPRAVTALAGGSALLWDLWYANARQFRGETRPGAGILMLALLAGAAAVCVLAFPHVTAALLPRPRRRSATVVRPQIAVLMTGLVVATGLFGVYRYVDGRTPIPRLAALIDQVATAKEPVVVLSEVDLRSVLGAGLHRRLVVVAAGGRAHETPFGGANPGTVASLETGTLVNPPPRPPTSQDRLMGVRLDEAIARTGVRVLVVGDGEFMVPPAGWQPSPSSWCPAGTADLASVYVARATAAPGTCQIASGLVAKP